MKITPLPPQDALSRVDELLEAAYSSADLGNMSDPLDETIFILMSQQTREPVYHQVWASLRAAYPTWLDVLAANPNALMRSVARRSRWIPTYFASSGGSASPIPRTANGPMTQPKLLYPRRCADVST